MAEKSEKAEGNSRREVLTLSAYALGVVGAMGLAGSANARVAKKAAQKSVMYQQNPKNVQY